MTEDPTDGCRYVIGELKSAEPWRCCGAEPKPGSSYCADHHAACYYRARPRRRVDDDAMTTVYFAGLVEDAAEATDRPPIKKNVNNSVI